MAKLIPKFDLKKCENCDSPILWRKGKSLAIYKLRKFCSHKCFVIFNKDLITKNLKKCKKGDKTGIVPKSAFKKGQIPWNKGIEWEEMKGDKNPSKRPEVRKKLSGVNCHLWKGGISKENDKVRGSMEMRLWKKSCMERDNYTDQKTGVRGGKLEVHHINNFSSCIELRTSISNGITFSKESHKLFHKIYGIKNNNLTQLLEFLNPTN